MSTPDKDAQAYFNLLAKAEVQLPNYPRGTGCYARAQHAAKLMKHHGRDVELIWALGMQNNFIPDIPNADWGGGMAFHVAVLDKQTGLIFDQAFCREPVSRVRWENLFKPVTMSGTKPEFTTTDTQKYARMPGKEPEIRGCTPDEANFIAQQLYLSTVRNKAPVIIERIGNNPAYES